MMPDRKAREEELHRRLASHYDKDREGTANGRYYSKAWLRHLIQHVDPRRVESLLDIGCGTGILYEVLREEGFQGRYIGTDLSEDMLDIGRKRHPGIDLRRMDAERLDFPDRSFEVTLMRSLLHHVPHPVEAIREMERVTRQTVVLSEPHRNILTEVPRSLAKRFTDHFDEDHTHFTRHQFEMFVRTAGITRFRIYPFGYLAYPWAFTDLIPFARYLPLPFLKVLFKTDEILSVVPLMGEFSWHLVCVCLPRSERSP